MRQVAVLTAVVLALSACTSSPHAPHASTAPRSTSTATAPSSAGVASSPPATPAVAGRPAHVVVVVMENRSYADLIGNRTAPYINELAASGALFTESFALTHPSEPNYVALFSGSTQGLSDDSCPHSYRARNLGSQLIAAGRTFTGYSDALPGPGFTGCASGGYARKHAPWTDFADLPASVNQPFTAFPADFTKLPSLSFVIPDLRHDMHDGTIAQGDTWLHQNLSGYAVWAAAHNSLLVLTWDEDDRSEDNQIPTVVAGAHVKAGRYGEHLTHYRLLRTLESWFGLAPLGQAAGVDPITDIWMR